jgi:hypothetical protein
MMMMRRRRRRRMTAKTPLAMFVAYDMTPKSLPAAKDLFSSLLVCGGTVSIIKISILYYQLKVSTRVTSLARSLASLGNT